MMSRGWKRRVDVVILMGTIFFCSSCGLVSRLQHQKKALSSETLFMKGQQFKLRGQPSKAIAYFKAFQKKKPKVGAAYFEIAKAYNILGRKDSVLRYAQKAAAFDSTNKWIQQFYARALADHREFEKAASIFHRLSRKKSPAAPFLTQEVLMWTYDKNYAKALEIVDSLETIMGTNEQLILQKQWLYRKMEKPDSVEKEVRKLVTLQPSNGAYYALLAEVYSRSKKKKKAIAVYRHLLDNQPANVYAKLALSVLFKETGQIRKFRKYMTDVFRSPAVEMEEKIDFVYPFLKYVEVDSSEKEDAIWLSKLLTKVYPESAASHALLGHMYYKCKKNDSALLSFKKALSFDSSDYGIWHGMMLIYLEQREMDTLLAVNQQALRLFPHNAEVIMIRGMTYYRLHDYKKAASLLQQALELDIKSMGTKKMLYRSLAAVYYRLHKTRKARKYKKLADKIEQYGQQP